MTTPPAEVREPLDAIDVMVIDAEPDDAARIRIALDPLVNDVEVIEDPDEAVDRLLSAESESDLPDLLIVDLELMGDGCWDLIADLRTRNGEAVAVVVISEDPSAEDIMRAERAGADHFDSKPINLLRIGRLIAKQRRLDMAIVRSAITDADGGAP